MKSIRFTSTLSLQANGKPKRFTILAYSGGPLVVSGFSAPVVVDLANIETSNSIPILIDHQTTVEATLGLTDSITNDGRSLTLSGPITGVSGLAQQVLAQSAAGHTWQASIGASVIESEEISAGQSVKINGQTFVGPLIVARRSQLKETSVLPMGADSTTSVNLAASAASLKGSKMTYEDWITSLGLDASTLTPEAAAVLQTAFEMQSPAEGEMAARALLNSAEVLGSSGVNGNPVRGIVPNLIVEPRISNTTRFATATAIQWFLFGAPKDRAITVGFLRGMQNPTVEVQDADFSTLGLQMRAFHDFGCALADPRGAYKAVGTAP